MRHRAEGVKFHIGKAIAAISATRMITLADGTEIGCDVILAGIGSLPNVELQEAAGHVIDNSVAADVMMQTSDPAFYAVGDCCSFPQQL